MTVQIYEDVAALSEALAVRVAGAIRRQPTIVLGLPAGRTPQPFYDTLAAHSRADGVAWSGVRTFNLDEFVGVPAGAPGSYRAFMQRALFDRVGIVPARIGFLDGSAPDLDAECRRYDRAVEAAGGIDLMVLGIGANGHIGFNEPSPALHARTHRARLQPATRAANAALFGGELARVPHEALSMGMGTILGARAIVLIATGAAKAAAVDAMIHGLVTTALPASFLQLHAAVTVMLDRAASPR